MDAVKKVEFWGIGSAAVLGVSVILPWVSAFGTTVALIEGDGVILLGAAALTIAAILWRSTRWPARVMAVLAAGFGLYEAIRLWVEIRNGCEEAAGLRCAYQCRDGPRHRRAGRAVAGDLGWANLQVRKTAA